MFAARVNQENAVYEQQTAAAAKNQGINGLAPKTPANKTAKTHSKTQFNNENAANHTVGKPTGKVGVADRNVFVTPAGPRNRAPLGIKTTNAKALQTPAAPATQDKVSSSKPTSPRLRRSKIKIHEAISTEAENVLLDPEDREIEYMPPREVPLPDYPEDIWPHDRTYPQLEGENLTRGWWSEYAPKNRGHGDEGETSDFEELCKKAGFRANKNAIQSTSSNPAPTNPNLTATKAVTALASKPLKPSGFAAPTAATKSRHTAIGSSAGSKKPAQVLGNQRFAAAKAASNSTIGYSKGRAVSASSRMRLPETHSQPGTTFNPNPQAEKRPTLDDVLYLGLLGGGAGSSENTELFGAMGDSDVLAEDEALENFQLDLGE